MWFMRQAGRYLPEYRNIRTKHSMLEAIQTPSLAAEITLQPLRRFDLDAAIIFADILNPLIGMGIELDFVEKEGPKIFNPISTEQDVARLTVPNPTNSVGYTLEAIEFVKKNLPNPTEQVVLGFAGAPFTLSTYLIEGKTSNSLHHVRNFIFKYPNAWEHLQQKLSDFIVEYLIAQVNAGVSAVQIFDSWAGLLSAHSYKKIVLPTVIDLVTKFKNKCNAPIIYFSTGTSGYFDLLKHIPVDGFSIDWRTPISKAHSELGGQFAIQGNLDPELIASDLESLLIETNAILEDSKNIDSHVFNLGHGITPQTPIENVQAVIEAVRKF